MAWSDAARRAAAAARKARKQLKPLSKGADEWSRNFHKGTRKSAVRSAIQGQRDKLYKKYLKEQDSVAYNPHTRKPDWAKRGDQRNRDKAAKQRWVRDEK